MSDETYIVVLMGGISPEREISLQSGKAVANALSKDNNNVIKIIVNDDMVNELDNYKIDVALLPFMDISEKMVVSRKFWNPKVFHIPVPEFPQVDLQ